MHIKDGDWLAAPALCAVLLAAGAVAGVLRAIRRCGTEHYVPVPRCRWLTARVATRVAASASLLCGISGLVASAHRLYEAEVDGGPKDTGYPPIVLRVLVYSCFGLLVVAPVLAWAGLCLKDVPAAREACRQAAKAFLLSGLAASLAAEVTVAVANYPMPLCWRRGCTLLGTSSGLLLLGLLAAQADGAAAPDAEPEENKSRSPEDGGENLEDDGPLARAHPPATSDPPGKGRLAAFSARWSPRWSPRWTRGRTRPGARGSLQGIVLACPQVTPTEFQVSRAISMDNSSFKSLEDEVLPQDVAFLMEPLLSRDM